MYQTIIEHIDREIARNILATAILTGRVSCYVSPACSDIPVGKTESYYRSMLNVCRGQGARILSRTDSRTVCISPATLASLESILRNGRYSLIVWINPNVRESERAILMGSKQYEKVTTGTIRGIENPRHHSIGEGKEIPVTSSLPVSLPLDIPSPVRVEWKTGKDGSGWYLCPK